MKKTLLLLTGLAASSSLFSQWLGSGPIYNNPLTANVGIGTATPVTALTVQTAATNNGIRIIQTGTTAAALGLFNTSAGARSWALFSTGAGNTSQGAGNFSIYDYSGGGDRFFIQGATGNIGIGTLTPLAKLQLTGNALFTSTSGTPTSAAFIRGNTAFSSATTPDYTWFNNDQTGLFHPAINNIGVAIGGAEALRINPIGFVGVGTSNPQSRLHINGDLFVTGTGGGSPGTVGLPGGATMYLGDMDNQTQWGIEYADPSYPTPSISGGLNFWRPFGSAGYGGNYVLFLKNDSKVGVHTNNPTADFTVNGNVLIGDPATVSLPAGYKLYVETGILTEKVKVAVKNTANWSDYVFEKNYQLQTLKSVEEYVNKNKHLPNIPSAEEVVKEGVDLGEMTSKLLGKVEELTLYIIDQNKKMEALQTEVNALKKN
jgi:hypothetical protein